MEFLKRLFGSGSNGVKQPDIPFGRYSDTYKTPQQYDAWDTSLEAFEKKEYLKSYRLFFSYLRDEQVNNVLVEEIDGQIKFELLQGSSGPGSTTLCRRDEEVRKETFVS